MFGARWDCMLLAQKTRSKPALTISVITSNRRRTPPKQTTRKSPVQQTRTRQAPARKTQDGTLLLFINNVQGVSNFYEKVFELFFQASIKRSFREKKFSSQVAIVFLHVRVTNVPGPSSVPHSAHAQIRRLERAAGRNGNAFASALPRSLPQVPLPLNRARERKRDRLYLRPSQKPTLLRDWEVVCFMTPSAPLEKSKFLVGRSSMVETGRN